VSQHQRRFTNFFNSWRQPNVLPVPRLRVKFGGVSGLEILNELRDRLLIAAVGTKELED